MEDLKNPDASAWIKAQADYARQTLDRIPGRAALVKRITELGDAAPARVSGVQFNNGHYYYLRRLSNQNIPKLYVRSGLDGRERLLVDPEATKTTVGEHYAIDYFSPSPDNRYVAYGISAGGSEESVLHVIDVASGKETGEAIDRAQFGSPAWDDSNRLFYNRLPKLASGAPKSDKYLKSRAYVHTIGTNSDADRAILGPGVSGDLATDPLAVPFIVTSPGSPFVLGILSNGNQRELILHFAPVASVVNGVPPWRRIAGLEDEVTDAALIGGTLYLLTHKGAPHFKVIRVDLANPDLATAAVVVPASDAVITGIAAGSDALYIRRMVGGISDLLRLDHAPGSKPVLVKLPFDGDIDALAADTRVPGVIFETGAWTRFGGYYAYDPKSAKVVDTKLQPQGKYDNPADLVSIEVKVRSHDGTMVPLSIVHKTRNETRRDESDDPLRLWRVRNLADAVLPAAVSRVVREGRRIRGRARARRRRERRRVVQRRLPADQAQHLARRDRLRRMAGRAALHVRGEARDPGRQPRRDLRRPLDHRAT